MNGQDPVWLNDPDDRCKQCEDCPHPNGCIRECVIEHYKHEDVTALREDTLHVC